MAARSRRYRIIHDPTTGDLRPQFLRRKRGEEKPRAHRIDKTVATQPPICRRVALRRRRTAMAVASRRANR